MAEHEELRRLLYGDRPSQRRYTQDSPVLPEVWFTYNARPRARHDLLLTPHAPRSPAALADELAVRLREQGVTRAQARLAYTNTYVAVRLTFAELVRAAL